MAEYYIPSLEDVKRARLNCKLTQAQAADLCRITPTTWARYEQGLTQMPASMWRLFELSIIMREVESEPKEKKLTVYEQRKVDREAEEQRQAELEAKYAQKIAEREQVEMDKREALIPRFDELMGKLQKRFGHVIKDFENCEQSHELATAIHNMEVLYAKFKDEVDAYNEGTHHAQTKSNDSIDSLDDWEL